MNSAHSNLCICQCSKIKYEGRTCSLGLCCLPVEKQLRASRFCALQFLSGVLEMDSIPLNTLKSFWSSSVFCLMPLLQQLVVI